MFVPPCIGLFKSTSRWKLTQFSCQGIRGGTGSFLVGLPKNSPSRAMNPSKNLSHDSGDVARYPGPALLSKNQWCPLLPDTTIGSSVYCF